MNTMETHEHTTMVSNVFEVLQILNIHKDKPQDTVKVVKSLIKGTGKKATHSEQTNNK